MAHIGMVIRNFREHLGLSRNELSQLVCSEKYLYLIEAGKRSPSSQLLYAFSDRLNEDLFIYYRYLDCKDPISVCQFINKFNLYRQKGDYNSLKEINSKARDLPDFKKNPWKYEILINDLSAHAFLENKYEDSITKLCEVLSDISVQHIENVAKARLYILLSTCYTILGDIESAHAATMKVAQLLPETNITYHDQTHIAAHINMLTSLYFIKNYTEVCSKGIHLIEYMSDCGFYDRLLFPYFFTAFSYYHISDFEQAFFYFKKGLYISLADFKPLDIFYISVQDMFFSMLKDSRANPDLVKDFLKEYGPHISAEPN